MEIGQVAKAINEEETIHKCGYTPIHNYLARIIPLLEYRQEAAKRYSVHKGKSLQHDNDLRNLINHANKQILELLNINIDSE